MIATKISSIAFFLSIHAASGAISVTSTLYDTSGQPDNENSSLDIRNTYAGRQNHGDSIEESISTSGYLNVPGTASISAAISVSSSIAPGSSADFLFFTASGHTESRVIVAGNTGVSSSAALSFTITKPMPFTLTASTSAETSGSGYSLGNVLINGGNLPLYSIFYGAGDVEVGWNIEAEESSGTISGILQPGSYDILGGAASVIRTNFANVNHSASFDIQLTVGIPEPSSLILGVLSASVCLRRRRF